MATQKELSTQLLNLKNDDYFTCTDKKINELEKTVIRVFDFNGVVINGPELISQKNNEHFPVLVAFRNTCYRDYVSKRKQNCTIVLSDMSSEAVHCFKAFDLTKSPAGSKVDLNDPSLKTSYSAKIYNFDIKKIIDIEWHRGSYGVSVISYDFGSNSIMVKLEEKPLDEKIGLPHIHPEPNPLSCILEGGLLSGKKYKKAFPSYERLNIAKPPTTTGINFLIKPNKSKKGNPVLYGSFTVQAKPLYIPKKTIEIDLAEGNTRKINTVVPMTLLVMQNNRSIPAYQLDMGIPFYSDNPVQSGQLIQGQFAIDILQECQNRLEAGKYMAYIVFNGVLFGPQDFEWSQ